MTLMLLLPWMLRKVYQEPSGLEVFFWERLFISDSMPSEDTEPFRFSISFHSSLIRLYFKKIFILRQLSDVLV